MPTTTHTPTPWRVETTSKKTYIVHNLPDRNDAEAALATIFDSDYITPEQQKANAAFIVLAVNSHAALVAALEHARYIILDYNKGIPGKGECLRNIDAALRQAREGVEP